MDYGIEILNLSVRAYNSLKRAGVNTIDQLGKLSVEEIKAVRNIGGKVPIEIAEKLNQLNMIKVYKMNDCDWYASKWSEEKTNDWYNKNVTDNELDDVELVDLDKDGVWWQTCDEKDIKRLGEANELIGSTGHPETGDLYRSGSDVFKWITLREAILYDLDFQEPYCIAYTEY